MIFKGYHFIFTVSLDHLRSLLTIAPKKNYKQTKRKKSKKQDTAKMMMSFI